MQGFSYTVGNRDSGHRRDYKLISLKFDQIILPIETNICVIGLSRYWAQLEVNKSFVQGENTKNYTQNAILNHG